MCPRIALGWLAIAVLVAGCGSSSPPRKRKARPRSPGVVLWQSLPDRGAPAAAGPVTARGPMGTALPFLIMGGSKRWNWLVACQPPYDKHKDKTFRVWFGMHGEVIGAPLETHLFAGPGPGRAIDDYLGADPGGRFVAVIENDVTWLLDMETGGRRDLSRLGDVRPGSLVFDPQAQRLALVRRTATHHEIVVLDLARGAAAIAYRTPVEILWAYFEDGALMLGEVFRDTDRNGRLDAGRLRTSLSGRYCRGPIASYSTQGYDGDEPSERRVKLPPGPPVQRPGGFGYRRDCLPDGRPIITSTEGWYLVGAPPRDPESELPDGPVDWIQTSDTPVQCPER